MYAFLIEPSTCPLRYPAGLRPQSLTQFERRANIGTDLDHRIERLQQIDLGALTQAQIVKIQGLSHLDLFADGIWEDIQG